jgi:hypothetical protein
LLSPDRLAFEGGTLDVLIADVHVRVEAPENIIQVLNATLNTIPRRDAKKIPDIVIAMRANETWEIHGLDGSHKIMAAASPLPQVAGAIVSTIVAHVAANQNYAALRAAVIENDGRALAFIGDDWESAITIATHLHGRGWRYIGSDNALLHSETRRVFPVQKSLYLNSSSLAQLPLHYRRAVEASPWYVTEAGISFYAVDPLIAGQPQTWSPSALLAAIVVVDGLIADRPAVETLDAVTLSSERLTRLALDWGEVKIVDLRLGGIVETCDLLEHWFEAIRP